MSFLSRKSWKFLKNNQLRVSQPQFSIILKNIHFFFEISTFHSQFYLKMIFFETYSKMKFLLTWENVMRVDIFWCQFLDYFEVKNCTFCQFLKSAFFKLSIWLFNLDNIAKKGHVLVIFYQISQFFRPWQLILAPKFL